MDDNIREDRVLPPHRPGVDTRVKLLKDEQGQDREVPWGPLYSMTREELLVLRKTLTDLLDKNWIRASSSPGGTPVLFIKKPNGGLKFCVDYRALDTIIERDRYLLPLMHETLKMVAKAKWISKVDKTAFRTRFGSYEWLVTPFGLAGAPLAFQRWINQVQDNLLGDRCAAYLDDVVIYTDGTLPDHWNKVVQVLSRLDKGGLRLDPDKCEFARKEIKYLGFVINLDEGIKVDPDKINAISTWEAPADVKGVRCFLGFANFYCYFIKNFAEVTNPLENLTKKGLPFQWENIHQKAFENLKSLFTSAPILTMLQEDRLTILECDASGWATGGCLLQYDNNGCLRPVAYFSKKLTQAECNYDIHDKELLAIIRCLNEWRGELMGLH
ncbi:hypothetical protein K3495_g9978 [Podosphaera aphanis]|nr:hypothetical protein K3495_g9978 [Podosphaera aphanis]